MARDMTHVSDVVDGIVATVEQEPAFKKLETSHRVYNVGKSKPERLIDMIDTIEELTGITAHRIMEPMQPGDVIHTYADISSFQEDYGFSPDISMGEGLTEFWLWYQNYFGSQRS